MVIMIIKGLFRRYERWNPVHPTSGAFWGMGVGVGCGVGWGPGFGPEVIGYVGAGCGIGFSVGITLAGFGIGLPANQVLQAPLKAVMATRDGALTLAHSNWRLSDKGGWGDGWNGFPSAVSPFQRESIERMAGSCASGEGLAETRNKLVASTNSVMNGLATFWSHLFRSRKAGRA